MKIKTLIIGLGKIGLFYNFSKFNKNNSNHSDVFFNSKNFLLVGGVEIKKTNRNIFKKKYSLPCFKNINIAYKKTKPELIVISVPIDKFNNIYNAIYKNEIKPKAFIVEKPGALDHITLKKFYLYCKKNKINIFMNYTRNFSNKLDIFKNLLSARIIGEIKNIEIDYNKGLYNACGHFLSLLDKFFNFRNIKNINIYQFKKTKKDYFVSFDIMLNKLLKFKVVKKNQDEKISILGTKGKISFLTEKHKLFLIKKRKKIKIKNDFSDDLLNMVNYVKTNINSRNQCYKVFKRYILVLYILNQISKKTINYEKK